MVPDSLIHRCLKKSSHPSIFPDLLQDPPVYAVGHGFSGRIPSPELKGVEKNQTLHTFFSQRINYYPIIMKLISQCLYRMLELQGQISLMD